MQIFIENFKIFKSLHNTLYFEKYKEEIFHSKYDEFQFCGTNKKRPKEYFQRLHQCQ